MTQKATIRFNMKIYDFATIVQAANDFTENFWLTLDGDPHGEMEVSLEPKSEITSSVNVNTLGYEFYNYVLGIMQS